MLELHEALANSTHDFRIGVLDFTGDTSLEAMVERVAHRAGSQPTILIGLSMGGWVAQAVVARTDARVPALVLMSSWTNARPDYLEIVRDLHQKIADGARIADLRSAVVRGFADPDRAEALADRWVAMAERVGPETFLNETSAILAHPDVTPDARRIAIPTLVVCGAQDALIDPEFQAEDARLIPEARFVSIENSGHNLTWDQPTASNDAVLGWLDDQCT